MICNFIIVVQWCFPSDILLNICNQRLGSVYVLLQFSFYFKACKHLFDVKQIFANIGYIFQRDENIKEYIQATARAFKMSLWFLLAFCA